jgi:hypothetical protein
MTFMLRIWEEAQKLVPRMSTIERESLAASLESQGQKYPVLCLPDGRIFDGNNRFEILGEKTRYEIVDVPEESALGLARSLNLARRQLSGDQLREAMESLKKDAALLRDKGWTLEKISSTTGVARSTLGDWFSNNSGFGNSAKDQRVSIPATQHEEIWRRVKLGETQEVVAGDFKVSQRVISNIFREQEAIHRELNQNEAERSLDQYKDVLTTKHAVLKQLPRKLQVPAADATMVKGLSLPQVRRLVEAKPGTAADVDAIAERILLQKVKDRAKNHDFVKLREACPWCTKPVEVITQRRMFALRRGQILETEKP